MCLCFSRECNAISSCNGWTSLYHQQQAFTGNNNAHNVWHNVLIMPSVLWCCWLGGRKGIRPVKNWVVGCWRGYVCSEMQTCIWPSWCHCHSLYLASVKSRLVVPFWYRLTRVVPDKGQLNRYEYVICTDTSISRRKVQPNNNNNNDRLTAFDPGLPG